MLAAAAAPIVPVAVILNGVTICSNASASSATRVALIVSVGVPLSVSEIDTMSFADASVSSPSRLAATFAALSISVCGPIL